MTKTENKSQCVQPVERPPTEEAPFFVVGSGRSGTTLLQTLLDAHPNIAIPSESHVFDRFLEIAVYYGDLSHPQNLRRLCRDILSDKMKDWDINISTDEFCRLLRTKTFKGIVSLAFELYAQNRGKKRWGDKTPRHTFCLKQIKQLFPDAKFIHLIRDGRDVATSYHHTYFGPKRIDELAKVWRDAVTAADDFKKSVQPNDFLEVHYENLVKDPGLEVNRIFTFLGEAPIALTHEVPDSTIKSFYTQNKSWHSSLNDPITQNKIGLFKTALRPREIEIFETISGQALQRHGYLLTTPADAQISPKEKITLWFVDFFRRIMIILSFPAFFKITADRLMRKFRKLKVFLLYHLHNQHP